jgi:hypothetical protein
VKDDQPYVTHIAERLQRIEPYTQEGQAAFMVSPMAQDAVIRNFEAIGEAAKQISEELRVIDYRPDSSGVVREGCPGRSRSGRLDLGAPPWSGCPASPGFAPRS